jgi:hypothetical protein
MTHMITTTFSGIQFVQRGKKFAMDGYRPARTPG